MFGDIEMWSGLFQSCTGFVGRNLGAPPVLDLHLLSWHVIGGGLVPWSMKHLRGIQLPAPTPIPACFPSLVGTSKER